MLRILLTLLLALASIQSTYADQSSLHIKDAWTPEAPPGRMMAGFMQIHNAGSSPVAIVDARATGFGHVELHNTTMDEGVMRMRRVDALTIDAGQTLSLEPGGLHVMLIEPQQNFHAGEHIEVVLIDSNGNEYPLQSEIRPRRR